jgi:hypothetical protein
MRRTICASLALCFAPVLFAAASSQPQPDPRMKNAFRKAPQNGWTLVHLEGSPSEIGFQHGALLAREIEDGEKVLALEATHDTNKDWGFYRDAAKTILWPHIEQQYRDELQGIADGLKSRGGKLDVWDIVAANAAMEWPYYVKQHDKQLNTKNARPVVPGDHCSAFVATGSYTKDGKPVIAHNNWTGFLDGQRWSIMFDIAPAQGHRFIMDGYPGLIHSGDDFGINDAGLTISETTITGFSGWDSNGIAEFVRARKALQYSESIDDFARIMKEGNNGGYANDWLIADRRTGEIAHLELGLKNVTLERTKDGYFVGSNFPKNEKLIREETNFDPSNMSLSANARHVRWDQLMAANQGQIDVALAETFLGDDLDTFDKKHSPDERTLCGRVDLSPRGMGAWMPAFGTAGAVQNKASDATMAEHLELRAAIGPQCGPKFRAAAHMKKHPELNWQKGLLHDFPAQPWTTIKAAF